MTDHTDFVINSVEWDDERVTIKAFGANVTHGRKSFQIDTTRHLWRRMMQAAGDSPKSKPLITMAPGLMDAVGKLGPLQRFVTEFSDNLRRECPPGYRLVMPVHLAAFDIQDGEIKLEFEVDPVAFPESLRTTWKARLTPPPPGTYWAIIDQRPEIVKVMINYDRDNPTHPHNAELMKRVQLWGPPYKGGRTEHWWPVDLEPLEES